MAPMYPILTSELRSKARCHLRSDPSATEAPGESISARPQILRDLNDQDSETEHGEKSWDDGSQWQPFNDDANIDFP